MSTENEPVETNFPVVTKEHLIADFKMVMSDTEALIKATANQGGEALATLRAKAEESLAMAKAKMVDAEAALLVRTKAADVYVHENPWQAMGIVAGLGLFIGFLIGRR
jgi:ElaB/YqjD/DUF883 family membrane-anchored ribosome-binding protein